jgi:inositol transport system permease protein
MNGTLAQPGPPIAASRRRAAIRWLRRWGTSLFLVFLIVALALLNPHFLTVRNLLNILTEVSIFGIVAVGMTFVIVSGGVDLSVGSLLAFAAMTGALAAETAGLQGAAEWGGALLVSLLVGGAVGWAQGRAVTAFGIPPFIVTLGGMTIWRGATLVLNDGGPITGFGPSFRWWGSGAVLGMPVPVLVFALVVAIGVVIERYSRYGRQIYAVGGNAEAARLSGLNVSALIASVYAIVGLLAGLSGFLLASRLGSAEAVAGTGYELRIIASVVIGGASLTGGRGTIGGTIVGALLIGVLSNGLVIMHVSAYWQQIVIGLIIVAAVAFDGYAKRQ